MTILDSLIIKLGLDSKDFQKGTKEVDSGLKQITKSATAFLAVIGGSAAMKSFIEHQVEANSALERFSKNLGESISTVSAWSQAAEVAGGSAAGLQGSMDMLSRAQTELQLTGQSSLLPYFAKMGVAFADMRGQARPTTDILLDLADRFGNMPRTTAYNMGRMMGIDSGTMQLLLKGRGEVELMLKRQREFNAVSKQQGEEAARLSRAFTEAKQTFTAFGRELLSRATPALEMLFSWFEKLGSWMRENQEFVNTFLTIVATGLGMIAAAAIPLNTTAALILGVGAAIALLYQDYQTFKRGGETLIDWKKWGPGIEMAKEGIATMTDLLSNLIYRAIAAADVIGALVDQDWTRMKIAARLFMEGNAEGIAAQRKQSSETSSSASPGSPQAFFESKGWTPAQAAGIVANLQSESGMNAGAVGDSGKAYGLAQWHPDRQANFKEWAGKDIRQSTAEEQMAFVHYELTEGSEQRAGQALRNAITAQKAGEIVSSQYERPADREGEMAKRGRLARQLALGIPGASMSAMGAGAAMSAPSSGGSTNITTNVGEAKIYTAATDAEGIAKDFSDYLTTFQANQGLF